MKGGGQGGQKVPQNAPKQVMKNGALPSHALRQMLMTCPSALWHHRQSVSRKLEKSQATAGLLECFFFLPGLL